MLNSQVESTAELLSIALVAQRQDIARYAEIAQLMKHSGNTEAGATFERLAADEQQREARLIEWASLAGLELNSDREPIHREDDPGVATTYDADAEDPLSSTPYKVLAYAVHDKQRSFRFFSYIAAESTNPRVGEYAEVLAREELGRASLLRSLRRKAWHAGRDHEAAEAHIEVNAIDSYSDFLATLACLESLTIGLLDRLGRMPPGLKTLRDQREQELAGFEAALKEAPFVNTDLKEILRTFSAWQMQATTPGEEDSEVLARLGALADTSFTLCDTLVNSTGDEATMLLAQEQTGKALELMGQLREQAN